MRHGPAGTVLPGTGTLTRFQPPTGRGVRVDTAGGYGTVIDTLSKVDLFRAPALCEQTKKPIVTGSVMVMVVVPT